MAGYMPKVHRKQGGNELVVASGGTVTVESGGTLALSSGAIVTDPSGISLLQEVLTLDIADGSAEGTYYLVCPHAGAITKIWSVIDGAVSTADITLTPSIGATPITGGLVTIATAASAAGDIDSATPSAANVVTAGQAISFGVTGGGSGGSPRIHVAVVITR